MSHIRGHFGDDINSQSVDCCKTHSWYPY